MELLQASENALQWCGQSVKHASVSSGDCVYLDDVRR